MSDSQGIQTWWRSTSSGNAAYLICVHLKKYSLSVFATSRRSSVVLNFPKNNSIFWKRWKIILPFVSKTTQINSCLTWSWEICFCSTWFITRIFRHQEVLCFKIPNNLKRIILKGKAVSEQEIFQEKEKKTTVSRTLNSENWTESNSHFVCELLHLFYYVSVINICYSIIKKFNILIW